MDAMTVVAELRRAGAELTVEGGRLRVGAPAGVLTAERSATVAAAKDAVVALLVAEGDAAALDAVDAALGDDGAAPPEPDDDPVLAATVANVLALDPAERAAWRAEVVAGLRWAEAGHEPDPHLVHDRAALRRLVPLGACLACGATRTVEGRNWCDRCRVDHETNPEERT